MASDIITFEEEYRGKPFTRKEAEIASAEAVYTLVAFRHKMLELFERRAHCALGYVTFEEYANDYLGIEMTKQHAYELRQWAKTERDTLIQVDEQVDASNATALLAEVSRKPLTRNMARELVKLPPKDRRPAYLEAVSLGATGKGELQCVKHIVTRRLNEAKGIVTAIPDPKPYVPPAERKKPDAPAPTAPKPETGHVPISETKPASPPPVRTAPPKVYEPEPVSEEEMPWSQWEEAVLTVLTCIQNRHIDADPGYRKEASSLLIAVSRWFATGR